MVDRQPDDVRLRQATMADVDAIVSVHTQSRERAYRGHLPDGLLHQYSLGDRLAFWRRRLAGDDPHAVTWLAMVGSELAGLCHAGSPQPGPATDALHIHALYVSPNQQGRGLGRRLLGATTATVAAAGFPRVTLHVYDFNVPAQRFYERLGWERVATVTLAEWEGRAITGYRYELGLVAVPPVAGRP